CGLRRSETAAASARASAAWLKASATRPAIADDDAAGPDLAFPLAHVGLLPSKLWRPAADAGPAIIPTATSGEKAATTRPAPRRTFVTKFPFPAERDVQSCPRATRVASRTLRGVVMHRQPNHPKYQNQARRP